MMPAMTKRPSLPGVHVVRVGGREYHYAYRGGPRLPDPSDAMAYVDAFRAAVAAKEAPRARSMATVGDLARAWRATPEFARLSPSTQRVYRQQIEAIVAKFDALGLEAVPHARMPVLIRKWRDDRADTPRAADYGVEVLSSLFQWGVRYGHVPVNPARGIESIHRANRADVIWTDDELARLLDAATPECARAITVAAFTGLRMGDVVALTWNDIDFKGGIIDRATNKSRGRTHALPPLLDEARKALDGAARKHVVALTSGLGKPWTTSGLGNAFRDARNAIGVRKRFHDLRGTAATKFYLAGFDDEAVAGFMGWEIAHCRAIKRRYVSGKAVALAAVERMRRKDG